MIYIKIHKTGGNFVTSICDSELVGKKFKEGRLILNVSEQFYKGELVKEENVEEYLKDSANLNLVGKRSCNIALKLGLVSKDNIVIIKEVPHAQAVIL